MPLKVLVLTNLFPTRWDPLRASFNRQQFERLGERHDVEVLAAVDFRDYRAGRGADPAVRGLRCGHFFFVYPPGFARSLHSVCWVLSLGLQHGRRLRRERFDCVLASWAYPDAVAAAWLAHWLGVPYVVKVHGSDLNVQATFALRRWQIGHALRGAGAVVAVSRALADKAAALGVDPARLHTLYNGVDSDKFSPGPRTEARARLGLAASGPMLLFVGNLKRSKGCLDLLHAFPGLLAQYPDAQLVFIGAGPCRSELTERCVKLGLTSHVHFQGAIAHASLCDWFRAADLACLPSYNEGVPNVLLEAMACGIPVVATRVGGIPEVVPECAGILVPVANCEALTAALISATERSWDTSAIIGNARSFRWERNIDQLDHILRAVARHEIPPPP